MWTLLGSHCPMCEAFKNVSIYRLAPCRCLCCRMCADLAVALKRCPGCYTKSDVIDAEQVLFAPMFKDAIARSTSGSHIANSIRNPCGVTAKRTPSRAGGNVPSAKQKQKKQKKQNDVCACNEMRRALPRL